MTLQQSLLACAFKDLAISCGGCMYSVAEVAF